MRQFGEPVDAETRSKVVALAEQIYAEVEPKRAVRGQDFAMDEVADQVVVHEADVKWDHGRVRIAKTEAEARPPFEWLLEITSDVGETDYFKHYLIREHDIVLAQRKVLTPVDAEEAETIMRDLEAAQGVLSQ